MVGCERGNKEIAGCRVSLYPMSDQFITLLSKSIKTNRLDAVWSDTDLFSTLYRGKQESVVDAAAGLFVRTYRPEVHSVCELTFSKGCPGDVAQDYVFNNENPTPNSSFISQYGNFTVQCKYSFYAFGITNYMNEIAEVVTLAKKRNLYEGSTHYVTILEGTAAELFAYFEEVLAYADEHIEHYVLEATLSVNSPSK